MRLEILFQDRDVVVVNKTAGLLVHRSLIDRHATEFALQSVRDQIGRSVFPVHRLDRPTSGALIFALSSQNGRFLSQEFEHGRVGKKYLALVRGYGPEALLLDYPLKEELDRKSDFHSATGKPKQEAVTHIRTIAKFELPYSVDKFPTSRYSLVEARPQTGRKHQIRRHLRHLGNPIIGDVAHGSGKHNRFFAEKFGSRRMLLACTEVAFRHPRTEALIRVSAPLAEDFRSVLAQLGWSGND
jgi:tRNA pseudouridine65 synthase